MQTERTKLYYSYRRIRYLLVEPFLWFKSRLSHEWRKALLLESIHQVFFSVGLDELEKIVQIGKQNRSKEGHHNYCNLAEVYYDMQFGK